MYSFIYLRKSVTSKKKLWDMHSYTHSRTHMHSCTGNRGNAMLSFSFVRSIRFDSVFNCSVFIGAYECCRICASLSLLIRSVVRWQRKTFATISVHPAKRKQFSFASLLHDWFFLATFQIIFCRCCCCCYYWHVAVVVSPHHVKCMPQSRVNLFIFY